MSLNLLKAVSHSSQFYYTLPLPRHRAVNLFLQSYQKSWIETEEYSFEEKLIEDLAVSTGTCATGFDLQHKWPCCILQVVLWPSCLQNVQPFSVDYQRLVLGVVVFSWRFALEAGMKTWLLWMVGTFWAE